MSSDGWNCTGPAPSQRCAPLMRTPMPGSLTAISSTNDSASSAGVTRLTTSIPPPRASICMTTRPMAP